MYECAAIEIGIDMLKMAGYVSCEDAHEQQFFTQNDELTNE